MELWLVFGGLFQFILSMLRPLSEYMYIYFYTGRIMESYTLISPPTAIANVVLTSFLFGDYILIPWQLVLVLLGYWNAIIQLLEASPGYLHRLYLQQQ